MKLSDYVVHFLADIGLKEVFVLTGGYAVNLIDSFRTESRLKHICVQHEQVGAMAAEAYARFHGFGAMISTNAPGALNLLNGIDGAWNDSIPCLFISGQVNRERWDRSKEVVSHGREIVDIVTIVQTITKYAQYVEDPQKIRYYLEKAVHIAHEGRPGPVLLDIPLDIQKADVDPKQLPGFSPEIKNLALFSESGVLETQVLKAMEMIRSAKRPVILLGGGLRSAGAIDLARSMVEGLGIPAVATWAAFDNLPHGHPLYMGNIGAYGNRRANFTIQNADLVLALGARLNVRQTGGSPETFTRGAKKIMVDLDRFELERSRVDIDLPICANLHDFLTELKKELGQAGQLGIGPWRETVQCFRRYQEVRPEHYEQQGSVNVYAFLQTLSQFVPATFPAVVDCGGNLIWTMQAYEAKDGQRVFSNMGLSSMGYSLAASIGVCLATGRKPTVCIIGDGGLQVHIQELQTIRYHNLPIKIFVLNNHSYGIIKQTIESWFGLMDADIANRQERYRAVSPADGYSVPDFVRIARAYDIKAVRLSGHERMESEIGFVLNTDGPALCDVVINEDQRIEPRLEFGNPLENQHPLLSPEELAEVMLIDAPVGSKREEPQGI
jgi:acetolactate synthase-1/2/3 large subunit